VNVADNGPELPFVFIQVPCQGPVIEQFCALNVDPTSTNRTLRIAKQRSANWILSSLSMHTSTGYALSLRTMGLFRGSKTYTKCVKPVSSQNSRAILESPAVPSWKRYSGRNRGLVRGGLLSLATVMKL
jgi:hypothetical protein